MLVHQTRLPHVLEPGCYRDPAYYERELERVLRPRWHCVASEEELAEDGASLSLDLLGVPLLLRRAGGELRAFRNVCAHRYAALCPPGRHRLSALRCPYHGWVYDDEGRLRTIPDADSFRGERELVGRVSLTRCALARIGPLIFVSLAEDPPALERALDPRTHALLARMFTPDHERVMAETLEHPCNWKIPIENVLETYHVAQLHHNWIARHPRLVRVFGEAEAGQDAAEHELAADFSEYRDRMGATLRAYRALVRTLVGDAPCSYRHHHAFPNLILGETPILSFLQVVTPTGPTRSRSLIRLYLHRGSPPRAWTAPLRGVVGLGAREFMATVLREDAAIYPAVQRGVAGTDRRGVLGAREERVWAFQRWLAALTAP